MTDERPTPDDPTPDNPSRPRDDAAAPGRSATGERFPATARWTLVFIVVILALVVAIWPRDTDAGIATPSPEPTGARATDAQVSDDELAQARETAGLPPCPVTGQPAGPESVLAGIEVPCLGTGETYDIGAATAGKPMLINLWAHWCLPCQHELPLLEDYAAQVGDQLTVLAVHDRNGANPFLALTLLTEIGVQLPSVLDPQGQIAAALKVPQVLPTTVLVRADGTVAKIEPTVFDTVEEVADVVADNLGVRP